MVSSATPHYPYPAPIEAYGNGGFRFAGMSHKGSILCLPTGIHAWPAATPDDVTPESLAAVLGAADQIGFLLLGLGRTVVAPGTDMRRAFTLARVRLEPMDTGAACRTYNVLLAERRPVAAALLAVE